MSERERLGRERKILIVDVDKRENATCCDFYIKQSLKQTCTDYHCNEGNI